jgi:hypothetical protein
MNGQESRSRFRPAKGRAADPSQPQASGVNPSTVEILIGELILNGFASVDRYRLGDAVERELARLFADQGVPPSLTQGREIAHLAGGRFEVAVGSQAEGIGVQVAQALYGGLTR